MEGVFLENLLGSAQKVSPYFFSLELSLKLRCYLVQDKLRITNSSDHKRVCEPLQCNSIYVNNWTIKWSWFKVAVEEKQPHQIQFINRGLKVFVTVSNSAAWSEINLFLRNSYWIKRLHSRDCRFSIIYQLKAFERGTRNLILFSDQFRIRLFFKWDSRHTKLSNHYKLFFTRKRCLLNLDLKPFIW